MDFSLPLSHRTRAGEEKYYRDLHSKVKKKKKQKHGSSSSSYSLSPSWSAEKEHSVEMPRGSRLNPLCLDDDEEEDRREKVGFLGTRESGKRENLSFSSIGSTSRRAGMRNSPSFSSYFSSSEEIPNELVTEKRKRRNSPTERDTMWEKVVRICKDYIPPEEEQIGEKKRKRTEKIQPSSDEFYHYEEEEEYKDEMRKQKITKEPRSLGKKMKKKEKIEPSFDELYDYEEEEEEDKEEMRQQKITKEPRSLEKKMKKKEKIKPSCDEFYDFEEGKEEKVKKKKKTTKEPSSSEMKMKKNKEKIKPSYDEFYGSEKDKEEKVKKKKTTKEPSSSEMKMKKKKSSAEVRAECSLESKDHYVSDSYLSISDDTNTESDGDYGFDFEFESPDKVTSSTKKVGEEVEGEKMKKPRKEKKSDSDLTLAERMKEKYKSCDDVDEEEEDKEETKKRKTRTKHKESLDVSEGLLELDDTNTDESDIDYYSNDNAEEFELREIETSTPRRTRSRSNNSTPAMKKLVEEEKRKDMRKKEKKKIDIEEEGEKEKKKMRKKKKKKVAVEESKGEEEKKKKVKKKEKKNIVVEEIGEEEEEKRKMENKKIVAEKEEKRKEKRKKEKKKVDVEEEEEGEEDKKKEVIKKKCKKASVEEEEKRKELKKKEKEKVVEEEEKENEATENAKKKVDVEDEGEQEEKNKEAITNEIEKVSVEDEVEEEEKNMEAIEKETKKESKLNVCKLLFRNMISSTDGGNSTDGLARETEEKEKEKETEKEPTLPQKFRFRVRPKPIPEPETELDQIWRECAAYLEAEQIAASTAEKIREEGNLDALCRIGKHQKQFLDEERGMVCSNCDLVVVHIRDLYAPFGTMRSSRYREGGDRKRSAAAFAPEYGARPGPRERSAEELAELRASAETAWDLIPGVRSSMFPHQHEGFEFVWGHIAGGIGRECFGAADADVDGGGGCIVSHAPGTGKSRLAIAVIQAFLRLRPTTARPVIVAPRGVLLTWEEEFRKWRFHAPFHNLNSEVLTGREDKETVAAFAGSSGGQRGRRCSREVNQMVKLMSWRKGGGVLGVSYQMFEKLAGESAEEDDREEFRRVLLDSPGLVVLDEGHIPRNEGSQIWQVLSRVRTRRRVLLSGTPFQNNFEELYNTMQVVSSGVVRREDWRSLTRHYNHRRSRRGGASADPVPTAELEKIKRIIDPFIHTHRGGVLEQSLPGIKEAVVFLLPTPRQLSLIRKVRPNSRDPLLLERAESLISVHPSLALRLGVPGFPGPADAALLKSLRARPEEGVKTRFLTELVRLCSALGERVLVFSQYLEPLALVAAHLKAEFGWAEEAEILCIDGKRGARERQVAINKFNRAEGRAKVMLVSTRAGGEGISLVGASRVVMIDTVWNPAVERQATRRAYRLGQRRFVYVYHLVAADTTEESKYRRQLGKSKLSDLVFTPSANAAAEDGPAHEDAVLQQMLRHDELKEIFRKISGKQDPGVDL